MQRIVLFITILAVFLLLTGCAALVPYQAPIKPPIGGLVINHKAPLMTDFDNTDVGSKTIHVSYKSTSYFHDWILTGIDLAWGEIDVVEVARQRGIKKITHADYEILNILGVYAECTIHIYGY